ncbi:ArsR/SmtB family transcription factor [Halocatena marina]|uniref:ArsR/SmtB family transcription factor n=1 Tax=Halocatena marina TaxID=2934937 RepID=A0ABD5YXQ4_9EURY
MDSIKVLKALSNENRVRILQWLADPTRHFPPQTEENIEDVGVCVKFIQEKVGVSQSTVSQYMATLEEADLVTSQRIGQWTYYQRNQDTINAFVEFARDEL